ncbi:hypothetical protein [Bacillus sp. ISL-57]|uniref:hypothetical protein n=1 Tax=Bacillus sp. ISL-57 TaxID=2819135 RepID=UPI001BEBB3B4|nr:hypothetical protein [Bacillus sp. ISL-57]MBT2718303.1 hypothetical protein [Bacillus sp. ISL-57]
MGQKGEATQRLISAVQALFQMEGIQTEHTSVENGQFNLSSFLLDLEGKVPSSLISDITKAATK